MLLSIFASLKSWGEKLTSSKVKIVFFLCLALGIAGVIVGIVLVLPLDSLSVFLGSIVGLLWLTAANFGYWFMLPPTLRDSLDYRSQWDLSRRRWVAGGIVSVWFLLLVLVSNVLPDQVNVLVGALNILVLVSLARFAVASDGEREEWSESKEEERKKKLMLEAYENGLIDEYGNPVPIAQQASRRKKKRGLERFGIKIGGGKEQNPLVFNQQANQNEIIEEHYYENEEYDVEEVMEYEDAPVEGNRLLSPEERQKKSFKKSKPAPPPSF